MIGKSELSWANDNKDINLTKYLVDFVGEAWEYNEEELREQGDELIEAIEKKKKRILKI